MKKQLTILLILSLLIFTLTQKSNAAESSGIGVGILLGSPTAITAKYWLDRQAALDAGIAFALSDYFLFYGDYLFHYPGAFKQKNKFVNELSPYVGVGGIVAFANSNRIDNDRYLGRTTGTLGLGVRIPFGIEWIPSKLPIGVFLELVPGISIIPATSVLFQGGLGIRYYF
jgi:hypothetical protein